MIDRISSDAGKVHPFTMSQTGDRMGLSGVPDANVVSQTETPCTTTLRICTSTREMFYALLGAYFEQSEIARLHEDVAKSIRSLRQMVVREVYQRAGGIEGYTRAAPAQIQEAVMTLVPGAVQSFVQEKASEAA